MERRAAGGCGPCSPTHRERDDVELALLFRITSAKAKAEAGDRRADRPGQVPLPCGAMLARRKGQLNDAVSGLEATSSATRMVTSTGLVRPLTGLPVTLMLQRPPFAGFIC